MDKAEKIRRAREACARWHESRGESKTAHHFRRGRYDTESNLKVALRVLDMLDEQVFDPEEKEARDLLEPILASVMPKGKKPSEEQYNELLATLLASVKKANDKRWA